MRCDMRGTHTTALDCACSTPPGGDASDTMQLSLHNEAYIGGDLKVHIHHAKDLPGFERGTKMFATVGCMRIGALYCGLQLPESC